MKIGFAMLSVSVFPFAWAAPTPTQASARLEALLAVDVVHGYRTIFPVPIAIALSWEPEQSEKTERISAIEASNSGLHRTFAPMIDVARDPHRAELSRVAARMHPLVGVIMDQQKLVNGPCTKYIYCLLCDYED